MSKPVKTPRGELFDLKAAKAARSASAAGKGKSTPTSSAKAKEEPEEVTRISSGPNTYQMGTEIGRGGFAVVFQAMNTQTGDFVAVKRFPLHAIEKESLISIEAEIELMQKLNHPNIVKYIDTIRTKSYLHIVLEFMENGSLSHVIKKFGSFSESLTAIYVTQVLRGLKYLHEQGVLHRDIKGANILTNKDGMVKLADFGVAMKLSEAHAEEQDVVGSPFWIAPEIIEMSTPTAACDIWSVGCIIIELLTGKPPYYDLPAMAALFRIVQDDYPPFPESISQALRDFLLLCFQKEPMMRASAAKLLEHPWLYNSSTNSNLAQTSRLLKSKSISSGEENNDADSIVAAIKMYQQVVSPHPSDISSSSVGESMKMEAKKILAAESIDDHANTNANPFQRALSRSPKKSMESFSGSPATSKKYRRDLGVASSADTVSAGNAVPFSMIFSTSAAEPDNSQGIGIVPSADSTIVGGAFVSERPPTAKRAGSPQKGLNLNPEYYDDGYEAEVRSKTSKSHSRASSRASDSGLIDADMERSYSPTLSDSTADTRDVMDRSRSTSTTATAIPQPIPDFTPRSAGNFFNGMDMHKIADADDDWDDIMVDSGITMSMESVDRGRRPVSASRNTNSRRFESSPPFNQSISYSHADGSPDGMGGAIMNMNSRIPVTRSNSRSSGSKASLSNSISASSISLPHSNRSLASSNGKSDDSKKGTMMRGSDDTDIMNDPLLKIKENRGSASYLLSVPSSYMLTRYQEDPEEESFDDLMHMENVPTDTRTGNATRGTSKNVQKFASVDEQDVYDDFFNDDTVSPPMIPSKMKLASASSSSMDSRYNADFRLLNLKQSTLPALSPVRENSFGLESQSAGENDDFDDGFEPSFESNALASKLRQRMKEATKEVTEEEFDDFLNYQFDEKDFKQNEQKDVHFRRSRDVVDIMGKIRPETKESKVKSLCDDLINIFNTYPEQRDHLITYHGVMPIIDMFEARADAKHKYENIVKLRPYVLRVINKIIEGSSRVQEQLSLVGLIPTVMTLFENSYKTTYLNFGSSSSKSLPSTPHEPAGLLRTSSLYSQTSFFGVVDDNDVDPVTLEAAKFIHQISSTSSLTLQMLIGAGGLSVLTSMVSFGTFIATPMSPVTTIDYNNSPLRKSFQNLALSESTNNNVNEHNVESAFSFVEDKMKPTITIPGSTDTNSNCMTIFQMGIDCITQVFSVQSSRTRDFCRLFVKLGLLPHLATAFQNLMTIYQTQISQSVVQYSMNCMSTTGSTAIGHSQTSSGQLPEGIAAESSSQIANIAPFDNPTKFTASALKAHGARLHRRVESDSNRSESSMNTAAFLNEADDGAERKYCKAVATLLFKFSRSDAVVAETMVSSKFGVITVIINILRSPELRSINDNPSSTTVSLGNTIGSIESLTPRTIPGSSPGDRRSKHIISSGIYLSPAYIEIIELLLKCLKNLSMEPSVLGDLEEAGAINTLIPLLSGPISDKCINHVLPCIFNMCRINKKRQEQAAVLGIVPHLKKLVTDGSHLRQFALPILFDLAHTSAATRAELWKYDIVVFYLDQLKESYWQTFALNSLNIWLSADADNVGRLLVEPAKLSKLVEFFRSASIHSIQALNLHKPLLDMMFKSTELACALSCSGFYVSSLLKRLTTTKEAIVLRSLLKMLQLMHQYHPDPKQFVLDNDLYNVVKGFAQAEGQVLVCQIANRLLRDFQNSTMTQTSSN